MIPRRYRGIAMRRIAGLHLRAIGFVMMVLLTVAIAIDLTKTLDSVRAHVAATDGTLAPVLMQYLGYRAVDIVTRLLPMACLAGAFVAELLRHQRMEPVILGMAGAGPGVFFAAMLAVGLCVGGVQVALEGWLRPAAVFAQVDLGIGAYADRFRRGESGPEWFVDGNRAIEARVLRDHAPELRDLTIFHGIDGDSLDGITQAARATPGEGDQNWVLQDVTVWTPTQGTVLFPEHYDRAEISLPLRPAHLEYHNIYGFYLPNGPLAEIASLKNTPTTADAETAIARRWLAIFLPGVFAFLGASLSQAGRIGRMIAWWRLLALGAVGYITLVSVKSFWALGEFGVLSAGPAAAAPLGFALLLGAGLQFAMNRRL